MLSILLCRSISKGVDLFIAIIQRVCKFIYIQTHRNKALRGLVGQTTKEMYIYKKTEIIGI